MTEPTEITQAAEPALPATLPAPAAAAATTAASIFATGEAFELAQRAAKLLAASTLLPDQFRNNVPNCVVAMEMAQRLNASPFAVFQNLHVIHGRPGWSAQFLIGMINASGRFTPLQFRMEGEAKDRACTAWARARDTGEVIESPTVTMAMAAAEGWIGRNGSKWQTMPDVMLRYRAASFFAKFYAPDITLGMHTQEEVAEEPALRNVTPYQAPPSGPPAEAPPPQPPAPPAQPKPHNARMQKA